jgi:hypothetical protein
MPLTIATESFCHGSTPNHVMARKGAVQADLFDVLPKLHPIEALQSRCGPLEAKIAGDFELTTLWRAAPCHAPQAQMRRPPQVTA